MDDLIAFITARLDEEQIDAGMFRDEPHWEAATLATIWRQLPSDPLIQHAAHYDPARVLREVAAKRAILMRYETACRQADVNAVNSSRAEQEAWEKIAGALELDVASLAAVWSDHPDYRQEGKP